MSETLKQFVEAVELGNVNALTIAKKLGEDGKEVVINLEKKRVMPERMESPPRAHVFHDAAGFIGYLKTNKTNNTVVLADVDQVVVEAVLDDQASMGFETIALKPPYHPEFALLAKTLLDRTLSIEQFAIAVMRNRNVIAGGSESTRQLALSMSQITVSSKIEACVGAGKKSVNGVMCTTEVKSGVAEEQIELPDSITVLLPIYINTAAVSFDIDITVTAERGGNVQVTTDSPTLGVRKFEVFQEILSPIEKMDGVAVSYGVLKTAQWKYNQ